MASTKSPRRRLRRFAAWMTCAALVAIAGVALSGGCSHSMFLQSAWDAIPKATPEELAKRRDPAALRADLDAIVALHERTCPNPYLRAAKDSIHALAERLKAAIDRPMTRREFLPLVMELQAGYRCDHYALRVPDEDIAAALARGERLLPFRAEPRDDALVVVAVAASERAIEPGDTIVRIGGRSAAEQLARLRALTPNENARFQDAGIRSQFRTLTWAAGVTLPTEVEFARPDGSRRTVLVEGVGDGARKTERTAPTGAPTRTPPVTTGEVLVDSPPFRCLLLAGDLPDAAPIALIEFPTMDSTLGGQWDRHLDEAIRAANARKAVGLIVDVRENGGGDTGLGDALLARITDRPYRLAARMVWRRSPESDELIRMTTKPAWRWLLPIGLRIAEPDYMRLGHGEDLVVEDAPTRHAPVAPSFRGPTCLLVGEFTFSAAMMLADGARTYDLMLTIGEPTGGVPNELAGVGPVPLPNSRIPVSFSQKLYVRANGDASDLGPVRPHIEVAPIAGRDAALERAVVEIRRMAAAQKK